MFFFQKNIPDLSSDDSCPTLHAIPLLITADSKAHHEIGLTQGLLTLPAMWSLCGRKAALLLWWISKTLLDTLCSKFIVVAPFVLRELIPRKAYDSFCLLKDMYCLVYSKQLQIEGWHPEYHEYFKKLFWKHAILFEEVLDSHLVQKISSIPFIYQKMLSITPCWIIIGATSMRGK